jgi:anti-sigma-K factor RskA
MNNDIYSDQDLTSYLLGQLPEERAERFDELSITDHGFAEALDAAERDLVDSYANGELSGEERAMFERRYSNSDTSRSLIEFSRTFQQFGSERTANAAAASDSKREVRASTDGFFISATRYLRWGFAAAAAAVLIVTVWFVFQNSRTEDELAGRSNSTEPSNSNTENIPQTNEQTGNPDSYFPEVAVGNSDSERNDQVNTSQNAKDGEAARPPTARVFAFTLTPQMRGAGQLTVVKIPQNTERISVRLELEPSDFKTFSVSLIDASNKEIWKAGNLRSVAGRKSLTATPPAILLHAGVFHFTVSGLSSSSPPEIIGDYPFRVVQ